VQAEAAETGLAGQCIESGAAGIFGGFAVFEGAFDAAADAVDQGALGRTQRGIASQAARTGAEARTQGVCGRMKEGNVARRGTPRRATRAAEDSGGADGEDEAAVEGGVARGYGAQPCGRKPATGGCCVREAVSVLHALTVHGGLRAELSDSCGQRLSWRLASGAKAPLIAGCLRRSRSSAPCGTGRMLRKSRPILERGH